MTLRVARCPTIIRLRRRHLPPDAGIQYRMQASLSGCRLGICTKMRSGRGLASPVGRRVLEDAAAQAERDDPVVAQLPDPSFGIPRPSGLLHQSSGCHVGKGDAQPYDPVAREAGARRFPIAFGDDELHGLEPLLSLRIVPIAHADEAVAVLRKKLLRASLARAEMQPHPRGGRPGWTPGWRGAGGGPVGRA